MVPLAKCGVEGLLDAELWRRRNSRARRRRELSRHCRRRSRSRPNTSAGSIVRQQSCRHGGMGAGMLTKKKSVNTHDAVDALAVDRLTPFGDRLTAQNSPDAPIAVGGHSAITALISASSPSPAAAGGLCALVCAR